MDHTYEAIARELAHADRATVIAHLDNVLPRLWQADYLVMPGSTGNLVTVTFGDQSRANGFCRYLFDHTSDPSPAEDMPAEIAYRRADDRVAAAWGSSRSANACMRDKARIKGFPKGTSPKGYDRGHFFAHSMGGGLDINLFPQAARTSRAGLWRRMENYCARHPGTFCFVRPLYADETWRPRRLEYGIFKMEKGMSLEFWGHVFEN